MWNKTLIIHSVLLCCFGLVIVNQIVIVTTNLHNRRKLDQLETFHISAKTSFDNALIQLDLIQKRINELAVKTPLKLLD